MNNEERVEPEPPPPADLHRPMRRLAQALSVKAVADLKVRDGRLRVLAERFLYPSAGRREHLGLAIELAAIGEAWVEQRLAARCGIFMRI